MTRNALRTLAFACAGVAMFAASPAAAMTVVYYYTPAHFIAGYVLYANDGHICAQWGTVTNIVGTTTYAQDCT